MATEFVKKNGGTIHRKPWNLCNRGGVSVVADPQGAIVALLRSEGGDPVDEKPVAGKWLWNELFTSDDVAAVSFYNKLAGYESEKTMAGKKRDYYVLNRDGESYAGILKTPWEDVAPNWLPYILVSNPQELVGKVKKLAGQVLFEPTEKVRNGSLAIIGALFFSLHCGPPSSVSVGVGVHVPGGWHGGPYGYPGGSVVVGRPYPGRIL
jgi:predicted enzyme related to lactoylglutathione lyase